MVATKMIMITSKELSPGNQFLYFMEEGKKGKVCDIKWCEESPEDFNESLKPIEIGEKVLSKAGFKYMIFGRMELIIGDFLFAVDIKRKKLIHPNSVELTGFHHLQNIVYFLSGKEITI